MIPKLLGHILVILGVIVDPKCDQNPQLFHAKKQHDFNYNCLVFGDVFLMVSGVDVRTLEPSKMSISSRRNTHFLIFGLPKSCSKNESPQSSKKVRCWLNFGAIFGVFLVKNASRNQVEKSMAKKWGKSGPQRP